MFNISTSLKSLFWTNTVIQDFFIEFNFIIKFIIVNAEIWLIYTYWEINIEYTVVTLVPFNVTFTEKDRYSNNYTSSDNFDYVKTYTFMRRLSREGPCMNLDVLH